MLEAQLSRRWRPDAHDRAGLGQDAGKTGRSGGQGVFHPGSPSTRTTITDNKAIVATRAVSMGGLLYARPTPPNVDRSMREQPASYARLIAA
jgi:hypothetical protein